jgi:hypothetical protein
MFEFNGQKISLLDWNVTALAMKEALENLLSVGTVQVNRTSSASYNGFNWTVEFQPYMGFDEEHLRNFGNLPSIHIYDEDGVENRTLHYVRNDYQRGISPFSVEVSPDVVDGSFCTAVDQDGVAGENGLSTGVYSWDTSFVIESRDQFSNRIYEGPLSEIQVIETSASVAIGGSFLLSFMGVSIEVDAQAGIADVEAALESLDNIGSVTVSTTSARDLVTSFNVTVSKGSNLVYPDIDPSDVFEIGDWIRLDDEENGPVYTIYDMNIYAPYEITLSSAYWGSSASNVQVYEQGSNAMGRRLGYQYIITFDSNLGDLPSILVDDTQLTDNLIANATASVLACNWHQYQIIETSSAYGYDVNGTFYLEFNGERTEDLAFNIEASDLKESLESLSSIHYVTVTRRGPYAYGTYMWTVRFDSWEDATPSSLSRLYADGHLLTGVGSSITTTKDYCPSTNATGMNTSGNSIVTTQAGRVGDYFLVTLDGEEHVNANVSYHRQGLYEVTYETPRVGEYTMDVARALGGGLKGEYYNNRWLQADGLVQTRIDPMIYFSWSKEDSLTPTGKDYISIRWTGFILPSFTEQFTFTIEANDGVRLWVNNELLIDAFDNLEAEGSFSTFVGTTSQSLVEGQLVDIKIEYFDYRADARIHLYWSSLSQPQTLIPPYRLFYDTEAIVSSPFEVTPTAIKSTIPTNVQLDISSWYEVEVAWQQPEDDGGSEILGYKVEWWSNHDTLYGQTEKQTLKLSSLINGGTFLLYSPSNILYRYPVSYNVTDYELEAILESMVGVGDVIVDQWVDHQQNVIFNITFNTNVGDVNALTVDGTMLYANSSQFSSGDLIAVCADGLVQNFTVLDCYDVDSWDGNTTLSSGGSSENIDMNVDSTGVYSYVITDLTQDSADDAGFNVRVLAQNNEGLWSIPSDVMTLKPMGLPDAPVYVELVHYAGSSSTLRVYWSMVYYPENRASEVTSFQLEWSTQPFEEGGSSVVDSSSVSSMIISYEDALSDRILDAYNREILMVDIPELDDGVAYYVRIASINEMGVGAFASSSPSYLIASSKAAQMLDGTV